MIILKLVLQFIANKIEVVIGLLDITSTTLEVTADLEESENVDRLASREGRKRTEAERGRRQ